jgi:hypothetical protein
MGIIFWVQIFFLTTIFLGWKYVEKSFKEEDSFMDVFQVYNLTSHFLWNWSHVSPKSSRTFLGKNTHPFAIMSFLGQVVQKRKIIQNKFLREKKTLSLRSWPHFQIGQHLGKLQCFRNFLRLHNQWKIRNFLSNGWKITLWLKIWNLKLTNELKMGIKDEILKALSYIVQPSKNSNALQLSWICRKCNQTFGENMVPIFFLHKEFGLNYSSPLRNLAKEMSPSYKGVNVFPRESTLIHLLGLGLIFLHYCMVNSRIVRVSYNNH